MSSLSAILRPVPADHGAPSPAASPPASSAAPSAPAPLLATSLQSDLAKCNTHVQHLLSLLTQSVNSQPPLIQSDADWVAYTGSLRTALARWQEELNNAADMAADCRGVERTALEKVISDSRKLKFIHEDSLRTLSQSVRRSLSSQTSLRRRQLLSSTSSSPSSPSSNASSTKERTQRAAAQTTATLQRMSQLMTQELEKSTANVTALDSQTRLLKQVNREYNTMTAVIRGARSLLTDLEQRDRTDKLVIGFACLVFVAVVLYILKKRVFWWLF
ncbi:Sec20-domain-containing protein, partial [Catenaria anguillulae PL171]